MGAIGLEVRFSVARRPGLPVAPNEAIGTRGVSVGPSVRTPRHPGSRAGFVIQISGCRIDARSPAADLENLRLDQPLQRKAILIRIRFGAMVGRRIAAINATGVKRLLQVWPARLGSSQDATQLLLVPQRLCVAHAVRASHDRGVAQCLEAVTGRVAVVFLNPGSLHLLFSQS